MIVGLARGCLKQISVAFLMVVLSACGPLGGFGRVDSPAGVTLTPPSYYTPYYSTQKAKYLGEKYSHNLDQLLEQVTHSPIGRLHFVNAVVSLGIGLFTHSASQIPDARYLEVIVAMPDILEANADFTVKVDQLFSQYGHDLLVILSSDLAIATEQQIAGYGLNFSWRSIAQTPSGPRLTLEGVVIYIPKEQAHRFVNQMIEQEELLNSSVFFARQGEQAARLIRSTPPSPRP